MSRSLVSRIRLAVASRRAMNALRKVSAAAQREGDPVERLREVLEASGLSSFAENLKAADAAVHREDKP